MRTVLSLMLFLFFLPEINSQEFNYWNQQVGARSSMLSGAVTAGVKDNSAIYYNPSALGYVENSNLSVSSDGYYYHWLNIQNGAGEKLDLSSQGFRIVPQIFSFIQTIPGINVSITLAVLNRDFSITNTALRNVKEYDIIPSSPGKELYIGDFSYYQSIREDWVGFGYGRKYNNKISIGFSSMFSARNQYYNLYQNSQVFSYNNDSSELILKGYSQYNEDFDIKNLGLIILTGLSWKLEKIKLGLNITFPRINLRFIGGADLRRNIIVRLPSSDTITNTYSTWQQRVKSTYKTPLIIDLGMEYQTSESTILFAKISLFNRIKKYNMLFHMNSDQQNLPSDIKRFKNVVMSNRPLINLALAAEVSLSKDLKLLLGIRSDYNYFDDSNLDRDIEYRTGLTYWDLYHFSGGVIWHLGDVDLSLGSSFSLGRSKGQRQQVNLSEPNEESLLFGKPDFSANARFNQISIFFGFTYYIQDVRMKRE